MGVGEQFIVGGAILGLVVLGSLRNKAEQVMMSKSEGNILPCLQVPMLLELLSWPPPVMYYNVEV